MYVFFSILWSLPFFLSVSVREKKKIVFTSKIPTPCLPTPLSLGLLRFFFKYIWKGICSHRGQCQGPVQWTFVCLFYVSIFLLTHLCYYFFRCNNIQTIIENPLIWHVWWWLMIIPIWRRNSLSQCITRRLLNTREIESLHNSLRSRGGPPPPQKGRDPSHYHKLVFIFCLFQNFPDCMWKKTRNRSRYHPLISVATDVPSTRCLHYYLFVQLIVGLKAFHPPDALVPDGCYGSHHPTTALT